MTGADIVEENEGRKPAELKGAPHARTRRFPDRLRVAGRQGRSGDHPVLREAADAARRIGNAAAFLSPTRMFDEPHLEESDWPRDLDRPETQEVIGHLADMAYSMDACLSGIRSQHNVPDLAKPELDAIARPADGRGPQAERTGGRRLARGQAAPARRSRRGRAFTGRRSQARPPTASGRPLGQPDPVPS